MKIFQNLFLTTNHANGLSQAPSQRPLVSPVGRSPIPNQPGQTVPMRGDVKNGKDKVNIILSIRWHRANIGSLNYKLYKLTNEKPDLTIYDSSEVY